MNSDLQTKDLIDKIKLLSKDKQKRILSEISEELEKKKEVKRKKNVSVDELYGIGKGIWKEDAQDYVNRIREDKF